MSEQQPGLRFDIYERVHLQEDLAEIQELNDVELVPHIQVLTLDDQAILKGNLLLTGNYFSEEGGTPKSLEHLIPVEITLPLNRIHRVEDIQVEIENFDIDLLSTRSMNVTGVLSLQGVEIVSALLESWREEEEVSFVHEVELPQSEPILPNSPMPQQVAPVLPFNPQPMYIAPAPIPVPAAPPENVTFVKEEMESNDGAFELDIEQTELKVIPHQESTVVTEEKKELKVAFGKKADEAIDINPYGIKSLLSKAGSYLTDKRNEEAEAQAALAEESRIDAVQWKRLFLQGNSGSQEFRKLKLCIVQKEDTLESIAKRYQLNPRELQLLNRLSDQDVSVGQVIYLPR